MASHIAMKPRRTPRAEPRVCAHCGRPVFTLAPRVPGDEHAYCSMLCQIEDEEERDG